MGGYRISGKGKFLSAVAGVGAIGAATFYAAVMAPAPESTGEVAVQQQEQHTQTVQPAPQPVKPQVTTMWGIEQSGRMYALWNGYVVEDNENKTGYVPSDNSFDKNVYDFDLGLILHTTSIAPGMSPGALSRTLFSELAVGGKVPPHIDNVRRIGCDIVKIFEEKHASGAFGPPPRDVMSYKERHCPPPAATTPAPR